MSPASRIKLLDTRLSQDARAHLTTLIIITSIIGFYVFSVALPGNATLASNVGLVVAILIIALQSITRFLPVTKNWSAFNSGGIGAILLYNVGISIFLIFSIPLYSPFMFIIVPVMFITIYYRGLFAYLLSIAITITLVALSTLRNGIPPGVGSHYYPYLIVLLTIAIGGLFERAGRLDEQVRLEVETLSKSVELEREQLASLIDGMTDAVLAADGSGKILFYNKAALKLLNRDSDLRNKLLTQISTFYDQKNKQVNVLNSALTSRTSRNDLYMMSKNGEKVSIYLEISPLTTTSQSEKGFILILRDITKEKSLDEERNAFISITSHELRTPISSAEASISLIMSPKVSESLPIKTKIMVERAYDNILYIADLINDLGLLTSIESGNLKLTTSPIDIQNLVNEIVEKNKKIAEDKGLEIKIDCPDDIPVIMTNELYLTEILQNFVSNAIKYTDVGKVEVIISKKQESLIFAIKDSGAGIGTSDKAKIFNKFYRSEDYHTQSTHGTGLGLYIALKLSEILKGKVWFETELHKGSTFYLQIPLS